jgi:hypothetical protein
MPFFYVADLNIPKDNSDLPGEDETTSSALAESFP